MRPDRERGQEREAIAPPLAGNESGRPRSAWARWKEKAKGLTKDALVVYIALKHPHTPWYARAALLLVAAYAFSPIDLIPDFIPILGSLDDLFIVPLGVALSFKLIPKDVVEECRARAAAEHRQPKIWAAAFVFVALYLAASYFLIWLLYQAWFAR